MKSLLNSRESVTVFAANRGLNVEATSEMADRIIKITSRFHSGQFYPSSAATTELVCGFGSYQRVVRVIAWLRHEYDGDSASPVVLQVRVGILG